MTARLHVGNLPYTTNEEELRELFSQAGTIVSINLPTDRYTGRPRGFGFIEMSTKEEADEAIRKFDGYSLNARSIRVELAKEREPRSSGFGMHGGRRSEGPGGGGGGWSRSRDDSGRGKGWGA